MALENNVVCDCQKEHKYLVPKTKARKNIYYAIIHENNNRVYCVVREKNSKSDNLKDRFKIVIGEFPAASAPYALQLIASSSSAPALGEWIEQVRETASPTDYKERGKRLTPEERERLKEQILILNAQGVSQREISRLLNIDKNTVRKILVI